MTWTMEASKLSVYAQRRLEAVGIEISSYGLEEPDLAAVSRARSKLMGDTEMLKQIDHEEEMRHA